MTGWSSSALCGTVDNFAEEPPEMPSHSLRADLLMLLTAMIWGSVFVAQRLGMDSIGPFLYSGLRFGLAALILLPVLHLLQGRAQSTPLPAVNRQLLLGGILMGLALALGINLQQVGLLFTSVTNSGFITGLYVIIVPLLGLFIGHRSGMGIWLGATLAVLGMFLLSVGEGFQVASGDWLQLADAFVWAVHVLLVGFFASRHDPLRLAVIQFITCALISLVLALLFEEIQLQAIIAALEAVFAAIAGAWFLGETLGLRGYLGCALMLAGMLLAQLWPRQLVQPAR